MTECKHDIVNIYESWNRCVLCGRGDRNVTGRKMTSTDAGMFRSMDLHPTEQLGENEIKVMAQIQAMARTVLEDLGWTVHWHWGSAGAVEPGYVYGGCMIQYCDDSQGKAANVALARIAEALKAYAIDKIEIEGGNSGTMRLRFRLRYD